MTVEAVASMLNESPFSPDVHEAMDTILKTAKQRGNITATEKARLLALVDEEERKLQTA
ncbi:MAG: hypothetical protein NT019_01230 [Candidatus Adlerbacteria bacterium]|nr:hypothetical protein [Candidatus Adlerbacteria bacterium]